MRDIPLSASSTAMATGGHQAAAELTLQQLVKLTRAASAMYLRAGGVHQEMLRRAAVLQREVAGELSRSVHPGEVLNVQAAFAMAGLQQAIDYSRELADSVRVAIRTE